MTYTVPKYLYHQDATIDIKNLVAILPNYSLDFNNGSSGHGVLTYHLLEHNDAGKRLAAQFCLSQQPHCCGSLFLSNVFTYMDYDNEYRNPHSGNKAFVAAIRVAEIGGYSSISCIIPYFSTGLPSYDRAAHLAIKFGFKEIHEMEILNRRTGHILKYYQKKLQYGLTYKFSVDVCPFIPEGWDNYKKEENATKSK